MAEVGLPNGYGYSMAQLDWEQDPKEAMVPLEAGVHVSDFVRDLPTHPGAESPFDRLTDELSIDDSIFHSFPGVLSPSQASEATHLLQMSPNEAGTTESTQSSIDAMSTATQQNLPLIRADEGSQSRESREVSTWN
jgi:hypothetical protein